MENYNIFVTNFFSNIWRLFTQVDYPGLSVKLSHLYIYIAVGIFSIKVFHLILNYSSAPVGKSGNVKISKTRKGDTK